MLRIWQKKILLVDDDEGIRIFIEFLLQNASYTVLQAQNGRQAVEVFKEHPTDLIVTDMMMPEMDGLELIETVRKDLQSKVPIIMLTAAGSGYMKENRDKANELGADSFLNKPIATERLISEIDTLIN